MTEKLTLIDPKKFPLKVVLSLTTDRLLVQDIGLLYDILEHMCGDRPLTHQIPNFYEKAVPHIYKWYPHLKEYTSSASRESLDQWLEDYCEEEAVDGWLDEMLNLFPETEDEYDIGVI